MPFAAVTKLVNASRKPPEPLLIQQKLHMVRSAANRIRLHKRRDIGLFPSVVMCDNYIGTVFPRPTFGARARSSVYILGIKQGAWAE